MTTLTKNTPEPADQQPPPSRRRRPAIGTPRRSEDRTAVHLPGHDRLRLFYVVPTIRGVYLSFTEYNVLGDPEWVGLDNYTAIAEDQLFWNALAVTVQYVA